MTLKEQLEKVKALAQQQRTILALNKFVITAEGGAYELHVTEPQAVKELKTILINSLQKQINEIYG